MRQLRGKCRQTVEQATDSHNRTPCDSIGAKTADNQHGVPPEETAKTAEHRPPEQQIAAGRGIPTARRCHARLDGAQEPA